MRAMTATNTAPARSFGREMLNKVPEVTLFFWIIKIMCTTVGETAADYLNVNLGFGLTNTTYFTGALLAVLLLAQFRLRRYVPAVYWAVVVVISVFGTLITDNMTDALHDPADRQHAGLRGDPRRGVRRPGTRSSARSRSTPSSRRGARPSTGWRSSSRSRSAPRPATSAPSSSTSATPSRSRIFGAMIAAVAIAHFRFGLNAILAFWLAYILTRPLGASIGDELSQNSHTLRRARARHDGDELHLPRLHPRAGQLPDDHQARPDRGEAAGGVTTSPG